MMMTRLLVLVALSANLWAREGFTLISLPFTNSLPEQRHLTNQILLNGSGVAAGDVDGDGLTDLFFTQLAGPNALFLNRGNWRFERIDTPANLPEVLSTGCAFADLDGDGDLDLVVNSVGQGTRIFINDGQGNFSLRPPVLNAGKGGMSVAIGDLDGDGFLDLYLANYRTLGLMDIPNATANFRRVDGRTVVESLNGRLTTSPDLTNRFSVNARGGIEENGEADVAYRNVGGTNFVPISWTGGAFLDESGRPLSAEPFEWGLAAMIRDIDGDGLADIFVCNDFQSPDRLWINQGEGKFRLAPANALRRTSMFSMAVDFADVNRDGFDDFFVADMMSREHSQRMREMLDPPADLLTRPQWGINTLFLNRGDNTFAEIARFSGLHASEWTWSAIFLDVDLDGYEDLLVSNGMERAARDLDIAAKMKALRAARRMSDAEVFQARREFPRLGTRNLGFRNRGNLTFEDASEAWKFNLPGVSHGMALADLDNDGDLDLAVNNLNAPAVLYRNDADAPRVAVRLEGAAPNTRGIGAKITVRGGPVAAQTQTMIAGGRYLSGDDPVRTFARGATIEVQWPSGRRSEARVTGIVQSIAEPTDSAPVRPAPPPSPPAWFEDVSARIPFVHFEAEFDDFQRQPLLPRKLGEQGPGVAWYDFDGDGWDDLAMGSGRGGRIAAYRNLRNGSFEPIDALVLKRALPRDAAAVLGWRGSPGRGFLLASFSNYEDGQTAGGSLTQLDVAGTSSGDIAPAAEASAGPVALADLDGDGDLDVFIGANVIAGRYPASGPSRIFRNDGGRLVLDATNQGVLASLGMVNGAVFTDFDLDKDADLIVTTEWGPVRVLRNEKGVLTDRTRELGLADYLGAWTGLASGDFDEDGRIDFVAGNWGLNTFPSPTREHPLKLFHGDLEGSGGYDIVETYHDGRAYMPARQLGALSKSLEFVRQAFTSNAQFSTATIEQVLGERLERAKVAQANWLATSIFLNRGDRFEVRALPAEAQFAPVFGVCVADFDGDGHDDIALAQNFFGSQSEVPRQDAGRGLILRGDGKGNFAAVRESGLEVYGEQRGMAAGDFDRDGRMDLAIGQNRGPAKLYRNAQAAPGIRVTLEGTGANPDAIGATLRLGSGPRRAVLSSSGWLSQNSLAQLLPGGSSGALEVRWPDGLEEKIEIPEGVKQIRLRREPERK